LNQQFVENLIALRNHYQSLQEQSQSDRSHAKQQLTHVDALLVDQPMSKQRLFDSLMELRNQYQAVAAEGDRQSAHAREQLTHVQALLADQLVQQHSQLLSMAALTENKNHLLSGVADVSSGKSLKQTNESETQATALTDLPIEPEKVTEGDSFKQPEREPEELDDLDSDEPIPQRGLRFAIAASEHESSHGASANGRATKGRSTTLTPMLPQYQQMTKMQAIESLLRENAGVILHVDYVIQALHGEIKEADFKAEKARMAQALHDGAKKGLWDKVPREVGCYTIDLKVLTPDSAVTAQEPSVASEPSKAQSKSNLQPSMLPIYKHLKSIDAVDLVINENAGKILTTDLVVKELYGKLSGTKLTKAKEIIGRALWRGSDAKRWQHLPGNKGQYTLDLRLLEAETRNI